MERMGIKQSAHWTIVKTLALSLAQTRTTLREGFQRGVVKGVKSISTKNVMVNPAVRRPEGMGCGEQTERRVGGFPHPLGFGDSDLLLPEIPYFLETQSPV